MNLSCYIGSPYSSDDPQEREYRARMAAWAQIKLMAAGVDAFSPVPGGHEAATLHPLSAARVDHAAWLRQTIRLMLSHDALVVLRLPGWEASKGLAAELDAWPVTKGPILFLDVADITSRSGEEVARKLAGRAEHLRAGACTGCRLDLCAECWAAEAREAAA